MAVVISGVTDAVKGLNAKPAAAVLSYHHPPAHGVQCADGGQGRLT